MKFSDRSRIILTNQRHRNQNRRASLSVGFLQKTTNHNCFKLSKRRSNQIID